MKNKLSTALSDFCSYHSDSESGSYEYQEDQEVEGLALEEYENHEEEDVEERQNDEAREVESQDNQLQQATNTIRQLEMEKKVKVTEKELISLNHKIVSAFSSFLYFLYI